MKELIIKYNKIRDLEYKIPLYYGETTYNCSTKVKLLKEIFENKNFKTNFRVCTFFWKELNLPKNILEIPHTDEGMHVFLEVEINGNIIELDPSWDFGLNKIFEISDFNGKDSTKIAVKILKKFSLKESKNIMENISKDEVEKHLYFNRSFYDKINKFLLKIRNLKK